MKIKGWAPTALLRHSPGPTCTKHLNLRCSLSLTLT